MMQFTDRQKELIQAMANNDMNVNKTSRSIYMSRNGVEYHLNQTTKATGLNPRKFYDLVKLVGMVSVREP